MKIILRLLVVSGAAALALALLTVSGCESVPVIDSTVYVSAAQLMTFPVNIAAGVAATPTSPVVPGGATSILYWQQGDPPEQSFDPTPCTCHKLFYVVGGNLMVVDLDGSTPYQPRQIDLGTHKADSIAAVSFNGGPLIVSSPADSLVSEVNPITGVVKVINLPGRTPKQLGSGERFYALSGSLLVSFSEKGEIATANVGAGATDISVSGGSVFVSNPVSGTYYNFENDVHACLPNLGGCTDTYDVLQQVSATAIPGALKSSQSLDGSYVIAAGTAGGTPVAVYNSGQVATGGYDINYEILADSTGQFLGPPPGPSQIVTTKPAAWTAVTGGAWMSIQPDQSVAVRGGKYLNTGTTYETGFKVTDPAHVSLDFTIAADDYVDVKLNGQTVYTHTSTDMTATPAHFILTSGVAAPSGIKATFLQGANKLDYVVSNATGGPTGLSVGIKNVASSPGMLYYLEYNVIINSVAIGACPVDVLNTSGANGVSGVFVLYSCQNTVSKFDASLSHIQDISVGSNPTSFTVN